jgi:uncharacterized membrane protein
VAETGRQRINYLDWLRGLACLGMFEVHCYDAWLGGPARQSSFFGLSQLGGTVPAPLFIFLSGVSCALVSDQLQRKGASASEVAIRVVRRGAEIFGLGLIFRWQEYLLGLPGAPETDLLRVDVLNVIGLSLLFVGVFLRLCQGRLRRVILASLIAIGIACATPPLWTTWRPRWLPWFVESYINGVHIYNAPQPWLFPVFPWAGFAFAGLAVGIVLMTDWSAKNQSRVTALLAILGAALFFISRGLDRGPQLYAVYDYWHTSPNFFLARVGICLIVTWLGYAWCRWGLGQVGFSPLIQLGRASLLVYWVHIEFVYGRFSILPKASEGIGMATLGLVLITAAMVLLAMARLSWKKRRPEIIARLRQASSPGTGLRLFRSISGQGGRGGGLGQLRRYLEDVFAWARQAHFFAGNALDRFRVGFERFDPVLELSVFCVDLLDFLLDPGGFSLRATHGEHPVRSKDVLHQQQDQRRHEKKAHVATQELAHLLAECRGLLVPMIHTRARSASCSRASVHATKRFGFFRAHPQPCIII